MSTHKLTSAQAIREFVLAGNAYFTLVSLSTGTRFTYRVRQPAEDTPHFVNVLTGEDNTTDYTFLGTIFKDGRYRHSVKSRITPMAQSARGFDWFWARFNTSDAIEKLLRQVEVWHEGRCGRCGRLLTVPESIERGLGPECAGVSVLGRRRAKALARGQEELPL